MCIFILYPGSWNYFVCRAVITFWSTEEGFGCWTRYKSTKMWQRYNFVFHFFGYECFSVLELFKNIFNLTIGSFKTVFKKRQNKDRILIILWILIFSISTIVNAGFEMVGFMFYRFQYKISKEVFGHLSSTFVLSGFISQLIDVPFLSNNLKLQDTTILVLALVPASLGFLGEAFFIQVWIHFVIWSLFYLLYFSIYTTARSAMC